MKFILVSRRSAEAVGSVMDLWPVGDYSDYAQLGTVEDQIHQHWKRVGGYFNTALKKHERATPALNAASINGR